MFPKRRSTYRIQLNSLFGFSHAKEIVGYLSELGISHVYTSPFLQSVRDSIHGYDIVDPSKVNEQIGSDQDYASFCGMVKEKGLGVLIDIVPNHMAISSTFNPWWWDVLEKGTNSIYANYFDIDWKSERWSSKVRLPILHGEIESVLNSGDLALYYKKDKIIFKYKEFEFPLNLISIEEIKKRINDKNIEDVIQILSDDKKFLASLLELQYYQLAYWQTAIKELNYRRFFDIKDLIGMRIELEEVFEATHTLPVKWWESGLIHGFRVDHPDGLLNPTEYFIRLKKRCPRSWIVVEKILQPEEILPANWPVEGSTGYDFLNALNGVFIDPKGKEPLTEIYELFLGRKVNFSELVDQCKQLVLHELFESELHWLTVILHEICAKNELYRTLDKFTLKNAITSVASSFQVYRTYVSPTSVTEEDIYHISKAIETAKGKSKENTHALLNFIETLLLLKQPGALEEEFTLRFQQLTGPVMAKGFEDTVLYRYNRLVALNEVGGNPSHFGNSLEDFHKFCEEIQKNHPYTLLASTTHDTKHSEDFRARLAVISEMPHAFREIIIRWSTENKKFNAHGLVDKNTEYLIYQTLIGGWPLNEERLSRYLTKAMREAKENTSWMNPNSEYETAVVQFANTLLSDSHFIGLLEDFLSTIISYGWINSLAQTLVKLTAPGIPDIYQGSELWNLTLVDPDNRQPVDYSLRRQMLATLPTMSLEEILNKMDEGFPKLWLIQKVLAFRKDDPALFSQGSYTPLYAEGEKREHVFAFIRGDKVITLVPRFSHALGSDWKDTYIDIPKGRWVDQFSGKKIEGPRLYIKECFTEFPVFFLVLDTI